MTINKVKRSMIALLGIIVIVQIYILLQSMYNNNNGHLGADIGDSVITNDTGTGSSDTDTGSSDTDTGSSDTGTGSSDTDTGSSDTGTGSSDTGTGSSDTGTGSSDSGTGSSDTGTGSSDTGTGSSDTGTGSSDTGTGSSDTGDTTTTGRSPGPGRRPGSGLIFGFRYSGNVHTGDRENHVIVDPVIINPSSGNGGGNGGGGGGGGLSPDDCTVDLSPSYYDHSCDAPTEEEIISISGGSETITFDEIIAPVLTDPVNCYYSDGKFVVTNYRDIENSPYERFIIMAIDDCLVHGIADTQRYYYPQQYITQGEVLKMIVRKEKLLSPSFNHFAWSESYPYRWTPYLNIAKRRGMIRNLSSDRSDDTMYDKVHYNDIIILLNHQNNGEDTRFVSRGEFASLLYQ